MGLFVILFVSGVMNLLGVTMTHETKVVRRTWEMIIREGVTVERLAEFLMKIPERAVIVSITDHDHDPERTVITFEHETGIVE